MEKKAPVFFDLWVNIIINSDKCFITKGGREKFFYSHQPPIEGKANEGFFIIAEHKSLKNYDFIEKSLMEKVFLIKEDFTPKSFYQLCETFYDDIETAKAISADAFAYIYAIINDKRINTLDDGYKGKRFARYFKNRQTF